MIGIVTTPTAHLKWYQKFYNFSYLIKAFTSQDRPKGMDFESIPTHTFVKGGLYEGKAMVYEASLTNRLWDYYIPKWQFRFNGITRDSEIAICESLRTDFGSNVYGFFQLLFFIRRKFWSWFGRDMRNSHNYFTNRQICTEIAYHALEREAKVMRIDTRYMNKYNANNVHPLDILAICQYFHDLGIGELIKNY